MNSAFRFAAQTSKVLFRGALLAGSLPVVLNRTIDLSYNCWFGFLSGPKKDVMSGRAFSVQYNANNPIEDRLSTIQLQNISGLAAAVYDGHGGWQMSEYANKYLIAEFDAALAKNKPTISDKDELITTSMKQAFDVVEQKFLGIARQSYKLGFPTPGRVGSCALLVVLSGDKLYTANAGDSQGIVISEQKNGYSFERLNKKLNADSKKEQARLKALFPSETDIVVCKRDNNTSCYVKGRLQPTRSLGDLRLKHAEFNNPQNFSREQGFQPQLSVFTGPYITHVPDIRIIQLQKKHKTVIMASDGLWDEMTKQDVTNFVQKRYKQGGAQSLPQALLDEALFRASKSANKTVKQLKEVPPGSTRRKLHDDISIIAIDLHNQAR